MKKLLFIILCLIPFVAVNSQSVNLLWVNKIGGSESEQLKDMTTTTGGTDYSIGSFYGTVDFDPSAGVYNITAVSNYDYYISANASNGNLLWVKTIVGEMVNMKLRSDVGGNLIIFGSFLDTIDVDLGPGVLNLISNGSDDIFIAKLDPNGNLIWANQFGGSSVDRIRSIDLDNTGNIYATGAFYDTVDFDPGPGVFNLISNPSTGSSFVLKMNSTGNLIWAKQMLTSSSAHGLGITIDSAGNVYSAGQFGGTVDLDPDNATVFNVSSVGTGLNNDFYISKLNASGDFEWGGSISGPNQKTFVNIESDSIGNIYISGHFAGTVDFDPGMQTYSMTSGGSTDLFVLKLSSTGSLTWAKKIGSLNEEESGDHLLDNDGNSYISGQFESQVDFDPGPGNFFMTSTGWKSAFVLKLTNSGDFTWAYRLGGNGFAECLVSSLIFDSANNLFTGGTFFDTCDFDPGINTINLTSPNNFSIFYSKLSQCTTTTSTISPTACGFYLSPSGNYTWSTSGTYIDTIPNAEGCDSIMTINLTINPGPIVNLGPDITICQGQSVVLDAGVPGGIYTWSTGETTQSIFVSTSGVYTVTVTSANGCTGSDAVVVTVNTAPIPAITGDNSICSGANTTFCAGPGYACYIWSNGATTQCITANLGGVYTVTVCDVNGCTGTATITLTLNPLPTPVISGNTTVCQGSTSVFNAGAGYSGYLWSPGNSTQTIIVSTAGPYTVTVTDANGCTGSATTNLTVNPSPVPTITGDSTLCPGQSTTLNAGAGYSSYLWSTGDLSQTKTISTLGTYTVTVTNANGCTGSDSFTITAAPPYATVLSASGPLGICSGDSVQLSCTPGQATYQWLRNNSILPGADQSVLWVNNPGWYHCVSTDASGCEGISNNLRVRIICLPPFDPEERLLNMEAELEVFPNPASDHLTINIPVNGDQKMQLRLVDLQGKVIIHTSINQSQIELPLQDISTGIYFLEVHSGNQVFHQKIMVK